MTKARMNATYKQKEFVLNLARGQFGAIIGASKLDRRRAFYRLKNTLDYPDLCIATDYIVRNTNSKFQELLFGNPLPKNYNELGVSDFSSVTDNTIKEINWTLLSIRKYAKEINQFLSDKEFFDSNLVLGKYHEAEKGLDKIEQGICFSLWSLENRFLHKELTQSSADNKEFLSQFNQDNKSSGYTKGIAHYLSIRAERTLSVNRFNSDLEAALSKLNFSKKEEHRDYYLFKLSFLNNLDFAKYTEIIAYDFCHSIIDRYLNLRKFLIHLITATTQLGDDTKTTKQVKIFVVNRINYLLRKINDPVLTKLKLFASEKPFHAFNENESELQIAAIDKYTSGDYGEVETSLRKLLQKEPLQFDLYELYVKSLIYQKKPFHYIGIDKSLQNQILEEMHRIISVSSNPSESGVNLLRIANNITSNVLSYGIMDFVLFQTKGKDERKLLARLGYNAANPIIHEIYTDLQSQLIYLSLLKQRFPKSLTIDFLSSKILSIDSISNFEGKLPEVKFKVELAKALQQKGGYEDASIIWENLIKDYKNAIPVLEKAIRELYICYEHMGRYDNCIKLYVNSYFYNEYIVEKIEVESLRKKIREHRFKVVKPDIELPVFYTITKADENETHTAFEKFNLSEGVCRPSELLKCFATFDFKKIVFYLKYTCELEILKHSIHIRGSKQRLEERLSVCQYLINVDRIDKSFYDDEIKYLTNILIIQKGLLELDESKIYVNEQGIISNELKDYEAIYGRFKSISKLAEKKNILFIDIRGGKLTSVNYTDEIASSDKIEYSSNPVYDIYKELFDAIKEKFLHSKFGIVAYLSTRIRHGVLLGEIRPIFEKHKLITQKEHESSTYRMNHHWENSFRGEAELIRGKLQALLQDFSYGIDGLIFDLIKKYLQVQDTEKNPDGWFDYNFLDENLYWFSIRATKSKDFSHFAKGVFEILWEKTDENLTVIRAKIQNETAKQFNDLFDRLENDMVGLLGEFEAQRIITEIKACSTETQTVIQRISSWFKRSGTQTSDFYLDNLVDIVMEHVNKTHPHKRISLTRSVDFNSPLKGEFYTHFADLLRILFENILKHSDDTDLVIDAQIVAASIDNKLTLTIDNAITNKTKFEELKTVLVHEKMNVGKLLSEGKSGFHKAYKILKSDFGNEENRLGTGLNETDSKYTVQVQINLDEILA